MGNPYEILGVAPDAQLCLIRKAYKKLALKYHPDKNQEDAEAATNAFQKVAKAYQVLSDPELRAKLDAELRAKAVHGLPTVFDGRPKPCTATSGNAAGLCNQKWCQDLKFRPAMEVFSAEFAGCSNPLSCNVTGIEKDANGYWRCAEGAVDPCDVVFGPPRQRLDDPLLSAAAAAPTHAARADALPVRRSASLGSLESAGRGSSLGSMDSSAGDNVISGMAPAQSAPGVERQRSKSSRALERSSTLDSLERSSSSRERRSGSFYGPSVTAFNEAGDGTRSPEPTDMDVDAKIANEHAYYKAKCSKTRKMKRSKAAKAEMPCGGLGMAVAGRGGAVGSTACGGGNLESAGACSQRPACGRSCGKRPCPKGCPSDEAVAPVIKRPCPVMAVKSFVAAWLTGAAKSFRNSFDATTDNPMKEHSAIDAAAAAGAPGSFPSAGRESVSVAPMAQPAAAAPSAAPMAKMPAEQPAKKPCKLTLGGKPLCKILRLSGSGAATPGGKRDGAKVSGSGRSHSIFGNWNFSTASPASENRVLTGPMETTEEDITFSDTSSQQDVGDMDVEDNSSGMALESSEARI
mmetsp:Transcript_26311/g.81941  ORF Transcript_26311/g.81941 Transcript_26311/m.81941 type:complete len:575 (-) Transcript_26311:490-2214(-)